MRSYNEHCPLSVATPHAQQRSLLFLLAKVEEDSTNSELRLFTPLLSTATTNDGPILWCHQIGGSFKVDLGCPRLSLMEEEEEEEEGDGTLFSSCAPHGPNLNPPGSISISHAAIRVISHPTGESNSNA
ncbi:hypothetical protein C4D60_Mb08t26820 [Musa balbisiana]|uniref:Uncharacterized protein n=1 Tax=Musa balbisiana TaxID=52838 RepID=A0A4S8K6R7_MUSBA|nr:hypothetical protein C4D60_Mb08t26820 [Musa balbisiana]